MVESDPKQLSSETFNLQVLSIKEFDSNQSSGDSKKTVKLRCQLSDGESQVVGMMNKSVFDRLDEKLLNF
jgi:hypothetical protein